MVFLHLLDELELKRKLSMYKKGQEAIRNYYTVHFDTEEGESFNDYVRR
jgi:hypothetical protein